MSHIEKLLVQYQESFKANDIEGLMSIYHEDIFMFDCWQYWSYEGKEAVRPMVQYWLDEIRNEKATFEITNLKVHTSDTMEYATFDARVMLEGSESEINSKTNLRFTVCATKEDEWKIKHQHSSQPIE